MQHVSVVSVPVSDQDRAKRFYVGLLGLTVVTESTFGDGLRWIQLGIPGGLSANQVTRVRAVWAPGMAS
jgi:catechol 2,3-dioxygenase-like lactoylglutathione lyase family enzyme